MDAASKLEETWMTNPDWQRYEKTATYILNEVASYLGLQRVEGSGPVRASLHLSLGIFARYQPQLCFIELRAHSIVEFDLVLRHKIEPVGNDASDHAVTHMFRQKPSDDSFDTIAHFKFRDHVQLLQ